jgi:membrane protein YqaA with SNARE-associated domain
LAIDIIDQLLHYFEAFGPVGLVSFLFIVFFLDAMLIPTLPEFFVMAFYSANPTLEWGLLILTIVCAAEVTSNATLFLVVRRYGLPRRLEKRMKQWVNFLAVRDERAILVNRVAPVVPFMGAFIATMDWNPRKSILYVFVGALVKYSLLIVLVDVLFEVFEGNTARNFTVVAIVAVVVISFIQGHYHKRRKLGPIASRVARMGDGEPGESPAPAPPPAAAPEGDKGKGSAAGQDDEQDPQ